MIFIPNISPGMECLLAPVPVALVCAALLPGDKSHQTISYISLPDQTLVSTPLLDKTISTTPLLENTISSTSLSDQTLSSTPLLDIDKTISSTSLSHQTLFSPSLPDPYLYIITRPSPLHLYKSSPLHHFQTRPSPLSLNLPDLFAQTSTVISPASATRRPPRTGHTSPTP